MNNFTLDQKSSVGFNKGVNAIAKVQRKTVTSIPKGSILERLIDFAFSIPDFRRTDKGNISHQLGDIIILMIFSRMARCVRRADIIEFGKHNLKKLRSLGLLNNGVTSEPTLCRVESGIDELGFSERMAAFSKEFHDELVKIVVFLEIICIDGKDMCGTVQENGRNPDIVSAYCPSTGITLATEACEEKSNEIKAVPLLIDKIDITGRLLTADAMSMQKDIIDKIRKKEGYFLIELKANQRALRYGVEDKIKYVAPLFTYTYVLNSDTEESSNGHTTYMTDLNSLPMRTNGAAILRWLSLSPTLPINLQVRKRLRQGCMCQVSPWIHLGLATQSENIGL